MTSQGETTGQINESDRNPNSILFASDRIYPHNLIRINYTTYDVRRSQDVVNTSTSHCDVMVLAENPTDHPFRYARVLGIYHANVVYVGPGMLNHQPMRMEFLWVRWYERLEVVTPGWEAKRLDCVRFPPLAGEDAFGFIAPSDLLRGSHIVPSFTKGQLHLDGIGLSSRARDSADWVAYLINR